MTTFQLIRSDYKKQKKYGANFLVIIFFTQGFWAVFQYRIAHFFYASTESRILRSMVVMFFLPWQKTIEVLTGISIPASAKIGHSFYIGHFGGIIFNSKTVIGNNCNISQGVTIGVSGVGPKRGVPVIGNNVYIGANSVIAGQIAIADDVLVGACSLVTQNVAASSVVVGVPAVVISNNSSKGYI